MPKPYICIKRIGDGSKKDTTFGRLYLVNDRGVVEFDCLTLENPWLDNKRAVSCIPAGKYAIQIRDYGTYAAKFKSWGFAGVYEIMGVKDRSDILTHYGNYERNTKGCPLLGKSFMYQGKKRIGVSNSVNTCKAFMRMCKVVQPEYIKIEWGGATAP